jgi:hypothetical protein
LYAARTGLLTLDDGWGLEEDDNETKHRLLDGICDVDTGQSSEVIEFGPWNLSL